MVLSDPVHVIKGIGPKKASLCQRLSINTLQDALECYPRDYEDRTHIQPIATVQEGKNACVCAVVGTQPVTRHIRKGMEITRFRILTRQEHSWSHIITIPIQQMR